MEVRAKRTSGAQRKMMRVLLGKRRAVESKCTSGETSDVSSLLGEAAESYVEWIQWMTHEAEEAMGLARVPDWC